MGFRFRRSIKIAPGIKLNVSKSGLSTSFGGRGGTINVSKRGVRGTVGIPGTGLGYSQQMSTSKSSHISSNLTLAQRIELYRNTNPSMNSFVNGIEQILGGAFDTIKTRGRTTGWPVRLELLAQNLGNGQFHWILNALEATEITSTLEPGWFIFAKCMMGNRDSLERSIISMIEGICLENLPDTPITAPTTPVRTSTTGCATIACIIFILIVIGALFRI